MLQKERKAKEQLAEKHINRSWEKELEGAEIYRQRQEKVEGTRRQPMFLMEQWTLYIYIHHICVILVIIVTLLFVSCLQLMIRLFNFQFCETLTSTTNFHCDDWPRHSIL
jgi:hypothetical protein